MDGELVKISFLGDVTLDRPMLTAAQKRSGEFDFAGTFDAVADAMRGYDCVVGNLETVFAGEDYGYNPGVVSYNSPDSFLDEVAKISSSLVLTTANNHCLDEGSAGIKRTLDLLKQRNIRHTGVFLDEEKRYLLLDIRGIRVAIVAFTAVMNNGEDGLPHRFEELNQVNCLFSPKVRSTLSFKQRIKRHLPSKLIRRLIAGAHRMCGKPTIRITTDDWGISQSGSDAIDEAIRILGAAKAESDLVVACVHSGGQFNSEPGNYSRQLYERIAPHADLIVGNHPHLVQRIERKDDCICAYSLGSFNISLSADYIVPDDLPEYSLALNVYLKRDEQRISIARVTFSVLKAVEDENHFVRVMPTDQLYGHLSGSAKEALYSDVGKIYRRCFGGTRELQEVAPEYDLG